MNESAVVFISMRLVEHVDNPIFHAYNEPSEELEKFWGIRFPKSLMDFYACAFPAAERNPVVYPWNPPPEFSLFPDWRDTSPQNVTHIRGLLERPVKDLVHDMKRDSWRCENWRGLTPEDVGDAAPVACVKSVL